MRERRKLERKVGGDKKNCELGEYVQICEANTRRRTIFAEFSRRLMIFMENWGGEAETAKTNWFVMYIGLGEFRVEILIV